MNWKKHKSKLLQDPEVQEALKKHELEFQIAKTVIVARINRGLSQKDLAERLHTKQSVISRVENAKTTPSLSFLKRLAGALNLSLSLQLK